LILNSRNWYTCMSMANMTALPGSNMELKWYHRRQLRADDWCQKRNVKLASASCCVVSKSEDEGDLSLQTGSNRD
jgi:hypothetical protein